MPAIQFRFSRGAFHRRICYHEDITGEEITTKLRIAVQSLPNVEIMEYTTMQDILDKTAAAQIAKTRGWSYIFMQRTQCWQYRRHGWTVYTLYRFPVSETGDALELRKKRFGVALERVMCTQPRCTVNVRRAPRFLSLHAVRVQFCSIAAENGL